MVISLRWGLFKKHTNVKYNIFDNMEASDNIRNSLIDKILNIRNMDFLVALDKLISSSQNDAELYKLTDEQKLMLEMSKEDIKYGRTIDNQEFKDKVNQWLNDKN